MFCENLYRVKAEGKIPVIVDFKRISPKEGELFGTREPAEVAKILEKAGAPAFSVVTQAEEFGGSLALLKEITKAVNLPVLRKDFIQDEEDLRKTLDCGAEAVLLICACMSRDRLFRLYEASLRLGLTPLVETHISEELELAESLGATVVGINNRDILSLEKDDGAVDVTGELAREAPKNALLISESGIQSPAEARLAIEAGADAVLIGTALWKAPDIEQAYLQFCKGE